MGLPPGCAVTGPVDRLAALEAGRALSPSEATKGQKPGLTVPRGSLALGRPPPCFVDATAGLGRERRFAGAVVKPRRNSETTSSSTLGATVDHAAFSATTPLCPASISPGEVRVGRLSPRHEHRSSPGRPRPLATVGAAPPSSRPARQAQPSASPPDSAPLTVSGSGRLDAQKAEGP
jgi:hypothetical protein